MALMTNETPSPANSQIMQTLPANAPTVSPMVDRGAVMDRSAPVNPDVATQQGMDIEDSYRPLIDNLTKQRADAIQRTAANAADIKNIFGTLTTIRQQDALKIADQFKASLMQQQAALAGRTAEARTGLAANQQGVQQAGAELGGGPQTLPTDSLTAQAVNQGIAGANQYQTVWEGLQGAMQAQTQQNLQNTISGYGFQQVQAVQDLQNSLAASLRDIDAQKAQVDSSVGQAKLQAKQALASAQAEAAMKQAELDNAQNIALINAQGKENVATINANAKLKAKSMGGGASTTYTKDSTGWAKMINDTFKTGQYKITGQQLISSVDEISNAIVAARKKASGGKQIKFPTPTEVFQTWQNHHPNSPYATYIKDYLNNYY